MEGKTLNLQYKDKEKLKFQKQQIFSKMKRIIFSKYKKLISEVNFNFSLYDKSFLLLIDKHFDFNNSNKEKAFSHCLRVIENSFLSLITKMNKENLLVNRRNNEFEYKVSQIHKENILLEVSSLCNKVYNA